MKFWRSRLFLNLHAHHPLWPIASPHLQRGSTPSRFLSLPTVCLLRLVAIAICRKPSPANIISRALRSFWMLCMLAKITSESTTTTRVLRHWVHFNRCFPDAVSPQSTILDRHQLHLCDCEFAIAMAISSALARAVLDFVQLVAQVVTVLSHPTSI